MSRRRGTQPRSRRSPLLVATGAVLLLGGVALWSAMRSDSKASINQALALSKKKPDEAGRRLRQLSDVKGPNQSDARLALCLVLAQRQAWGQVHKPFAQVDLQSCRPDLLYALGQQALNSDHIAIGRRALETLASRRIGESTAALETLIAHYENWAEVDRAISAARKLTELDRARAKNWATLARVLGLAERAHESLEAAREALHRQPSSRLERQLKHHIAQQLIAQGEFTAAARQLDELQKSEGDNPSLVRTQIELCRRDGRSVEALQLLNRVFPKISDHSTSYLQRGQVFLALRRFDEAARDLERYLRGNPFDGTAEDKLSEAYRGMGDTKQADEHHERAERLNAIRARIRDIVRQRAANPPNPAPCFQLAALSRDLGEEAAARLWEERALALERAK